MISTTTFRSFNGTIYVRLPPTFTEYFNLKRQIEDAQRNETEPECKIEDQDENKLMVTFKQTRDKVLSDVKKIDAKINKAKTGAAKRMLLVEKNNLLEELIVSQTPIQKEV